MIEFQYRTNEYNLKQYLFYLTINNFINYLYNYEILVVVEKIPQLVKP